MSLKRYLPFILIAVVAVTAIGAGTYLYRTKVAAAAKHDGHDHDHAHVDGPGKPGAVPPHIRGERTAPVTIEEFADFQCPPCGTIAGILHQLEQEYRGRVRIVFRHFPLDNHQHARLAARSTEAAAAQGKFWEMHDIIYQNRNTWSVESDARPLFTQYAGIIGLDLAKFAADLDNPELAARVAADQERGHSLNVSSTPTVFLNQRQVPPSSFSPQGLRALIDAALAEKPQP